MTEQNPGQPRHAESGADGAAGSGGYPQASGGYPQASGGFPAATPGAHSGAYQSAAIDSTSVMPNAQPQHGQHSQPQQGFGSGAAQSQSAQHSGAHAAYSATGQQGQQSTQFGAQQQYGQAGAVPGAQQQNPGKATVGGMTLGLNQLLGIVGAVAAVIAFFCCFLTFTKYSFDRGSYVSHEEQTETFNGFMAVGWYGAAMLAAAIIVGLSILRKERTTAAVGIAGGAWLAVLFERLTSDAIRSSNVSDSTNWAVGTILAVIFGLIAVVMFTATAVLPEGAVTGGNAKSTRTTSVPGAQGGQAAGGQNGFAAGGQNGFAAGGPNSFATSGQEGFATSGQEGFATGGQSSFATGGQEGFAAGGQNGYAAGAPQSGIGQQGFGYNAGHNPQQAAGQNPGPALSHNQAQAPAQNPEQNPGQGYGQ